MIESSLPRKGVSILYECVFVKFYQIDAPKSPDTAKKLIFFGNIGRLIRKGSKNRERDSEGGERSNCQLDPQGGVLT